MNFIPRLKKYADKLGNLEVGKTYASGFMNLGNLIRLILLFVSSVTINSSRFLSLRTNKA